MIRIKFIKYFSVFLTLLFFYPTISSSVSPEFKDGEGTSSGEAIMAVKKIVDEKLSELRESLVFKK